MRHFQRKKEDFSINKALHDYLREMGWTPGDSIKVREFSELVGIKEKNLSDLIRNVRAIGPMIQARLFIGTGDNRFKPRDELEGAALEEWKKNPTPQITVAKVGDKAAASSPQPDNPLYLHEQLIRLFNEYSIGSKKGREYTLVSKWIKLHETSYRPLLRKEGVFTVGIKIRMYLGFNDPAFAPLTENEKARCEFWRQQIPRPLPFIKTEKQQVDGRMPAEAEAETSIPISSIGQALLDDEAFLTRLAVKINKRLEQRLVMSGVKPETAPVKPTKTETAAPEDFSEGEVIPASFVKEVADLLRQTTSKLNTIVSLGNTQRKEVQAELEGLFKKLEESLVGCLLLTRALSRTATREAAMQILQGERAFVERIRQSGLTEKQ